MSGPGLPVVRAARSGQSRGASTCSMEAPARPCQPRVLGGPRVRRVSLGCRGPGLGVSTQAMAEVSVVTLALSRDGIRVRARGRDRVRVSTQAMAEVETTACSRATKGPQPLGASWLGLG